MDTLNIVKYGDIYVTVIRICMVENIYHKLDRNTIILRTVIENQIFMHTIRSHIERKASFNSITTVIIQLRCIWWAKNNN